MTSGLEFLETDERPTCVLWQDYIANGSFESARDARFAGSLSPRERRKMIDIRYIKFLVIAAGVCGLIAGFIWMRGQMPSMGAAVLSFVLGAALTSLVTVHLPVFRRYYNAKSLQETQKYRGLANEQAAPIMASLFAGAAAGLLLYVLGVEDVVGPAFVGAVSAGVMSQYHRTKR
jgi:hypothetical protein